MFKQTSLENLSWLSAWVKLGLLKSAKYGTGLVVLLLNLGLAMPAAAQPAQGLLREVYNGIPGVSVSDLIGAAIFPNKPTATGYVTNFFEAPTDIMEEYGQRLRGFIVPPVTGNYTFWIASDDGSQLWLSTDDSVTQKKLIASVNSWTPSRSWDLEANQKSAAIRLVAGQSYYVEALMKEGGGGDNLAVRWLRPDGVNEAPIPGTRLIPWGVSLKLPTLLRQPRNTSAVEGLVAKFDLQLDPLGPSSYQWRRNGVALLGATNSVLEYLPVTLADQGARFSVALTNKYGAALSEEAVLTVIPDLTIPTLVKVENRANRILKVTFSEALLASRAQIAANYQVSGNASVEGAVLEPDGQTVVLTVSPLIYGESYTLTVSGVSDRAGAPNFILPRSQSSFVVSEYTPLGVGDSSQPGNLVRLGPDRFDLTGAGLVIGGSQDQFQFASELKTGDFDLQARLEGVTVSDAFLHAGLMVRDSLAANARFAAIFASSVQLGCFFESRNTVGTATTSQSLRAGFPVNYPQTWLRLRRVGSQFTGFASLDGLGWTQLGTTTLASAPATLYFGLAISSQNSEVPLTARFRDIGPVKRTVEVPWTWSSESMGPFVRSTGIVLSELMYHPREDSSGRNLEFIELYNAGSVVEDMSGAELRGEIQYTFPEGFLLQAGAFVVIAARPADLEAAYGVTQVMGPYSRQLSNEGGVVTLRAKQGDTLFSVAYETSHPWPVAADGSGHSLTLVRPSYGPSDPRAWGASQIMGGTPGGPEILGARPDGGVVINEILAHTDDPIVDFVELLNTRITEMDLSGYIITDDLRTNRFRIPEGTILGGRRHLVFDQNQLGFRLSAAGETLYLINPRGTGIVDVLRFGPQENGVSLGRQPDGAASFRRLSKVTPGAANATWRAEEIVMSEIMYNPISGLDDDEYLELYNRSSAPVDLGGWRFTRGLDYRIPVGVTLPVGGFLVVAKNPAQLLATHPSLNPATLLGGYNGTLANGGERIVLARPDELFSTNAVGAVSSSRIYIEIADVFYGSGGSWGTWADGGGSSLELRDLNADPMQGANWGDSDETTKSEWTSVSFTGRLDNGNSGFPPNQLQITLQGGGEALVDDVEVVRQGTTANLVNNSGFETGTGAVATGWTLQGNHLESFIQNTDAASGARCLHIKTQARGDTGINRIRTPLTSGLTDGSTATLRARVRWIRGWPEVLFRLRGSWLEMPVALAVPRNLGTPGQVNSRRLDNAGPILSEVTHSPPLPTTGQAVTVTARVADPEGISSVQLIGRVDGTSTTVSVVLRDDGTLGDAFPGDGIYSGIISGRSDGTLVAFRLEAKDASTTPVTSQFPMDSPVHQCLVRWGDPIPFGTLGHYHMWNTVAVESARNNTTPLNNTFRDLTFVYGNSRVIYAGGFKDKGSPFHGGSGDWYVAFPSDQPILGTTELALVSTGNGGGDYTNLREQVCFSIARDIGAGYLQRRYIKLFRNGGQFREVMEDTEEPNGQYAERFENKGTRPDLYKIEDWFEFQDDGTSFSNVDASLQRFSSPPGVANAPLKAARYRWSFRKRAVQDSANNFTNLFNLVETMNATGSGYPSRVFSTVDVDQWMRTFAFERIVGNWDSYGMGRGKNMYAYKRDGTTWKLFPWDVDFALDGGGNGPTDALWGAGDPVINRMFDDFAMRRRLWQAYRDAINGPLLPERVAREANSRASVLKNNGVSSASNAGARNYLATRRETILKAYKAADVPLLEITSNGGNTFTTSATTVVLTGKAPLALANLTVNDVPYPVTWTGYTTWSLTVPLLQRTTVLTIAGTDRFGVLIPGNSDSQQIITTGVVPRIEDFVVINEIQYNSALPSSSFLELYNSSPNTPFDLSGLRFEGVGYTFPVGSIIPAGGFKVIAGNAAGFSVAYGSSVPLLGVFPGTLDNDGERLALVRPDPTGGTNDLVIDEVRYSNRLPWPTNAAGFGPSLQLLDARIDNWRPGNWIATATNALNRATPGAANAERLTLDAFPLVWLNELLPVNTTGPLDNVGEHEPYIELYNSGSTDLDLSGYFLTDNYTLPNRWPFPSGTVVGANKFLVVWADGQTSQSTPLAPHTNFRLSPSGGSVALVRQQGSPAVSAVMDFIDYGAVNPNRSYGSYPDGEVFSRRVFEFVTPGTSNNPGVTEAHITINEFMAVNGLSMKDPVDGDYDDWFELYNAGTAAVDLTGFYLTDNLTNSTQFRIPAGYTIPAGGFLQVWADNETAQNTILNGDLHVNFRLAAAVEQLGLFDPNGRLVDGLSYSNQVEDISNGRFPDGATGPLLVLVTPTPKKPNVIAGGNLPPVFLPIGNRSVNEEALLQFTVQATDADASQVLSYSLGADAALGMSLDAVTGVFTWRPTEAQGPGVFLVTLRVTDNGTPARSTVERITVTVDEVDRLPILGSLPDRVVNEGSLLTFTAEASDPDLPAQSLRFSLVNPPIGAVLDATTGVFEWVPNEIQGPGVFSLTIRVSQLGSIEAVGDRTFSVTVNEVDNSPVIVQLAPVSVIEGRTLVVTNRAIDPDATPVALSYSLPAGAPEGVRLDSVTGVLTWDTSEKDGPGSHLILIRVTQTGTPALSDQYALGVTMLEDNQAPQLNPVADQWVNEGETVSFMAVATDSDRPAQTLTYSLEPNTPTGARLDPVTGVFDWLVDAEAGASTNLISLRVTDNGPGTLSALQAFRVITRPRFRVVINEVMHHPSVTNAAYVELVNPSKNAAWVLDGLRLTGLDLSYTFPVGTTLAPGAMICIASQLAAFRSAYGSQPTVSGVWTGRLRADGDVLRLVQPSEGNQGEIILDELRFESTDPWPAAARGAGASLQLVDNQRDNTRLGNWSSTASFNGRRDLVVMTNKWSYFQTGPADSKWNSADFVDSKWPVGRGLLYVESAELPQPKNTALTLGQITYYFRTSFVLPTVPTGARLVLKTVLDDGAIFYLNGQEVFRQGMDPTGLIDFNSLATLTVTDATVDGPFTVPATALKAGLNVLAVEVHQISAGSSDIVFGCSLDLEGGDVPSFTPGQLNTVGLALPEFPSVFVTEVLARNSTGILDGKGAREPWIEVANSGNNSVNLEGWALSVTSGDLGSWSFPAGAFLPPHSLTVIFADGEPDQTVGSEWHTSFRLNPTSGVVLLSRLQPGGRAVVDYLRYAGLESDQSAVPDPNAMAGGSRPATPTPGTEIQGNRPPRFASVLDGSVAVGEFLTLPITATDPDVGQILTYSLVFGPANLTVSTKGEIRWNPEAFQAGPHPVRVRVQDNGNPVLLDETTFTLTATVPLGPVVLGYRLQGQIFELLLPTIRGRQYRLEISDQLDQGRWRVLQTLTGTGALEVIPDPAPLVPGGHFYRVTALP